MSEAMDDATYVRLRDCLGAAEFDAGMSAVPRTLAAERGERHG
jgi:hypothetical protein